MDSRISQSLRFFEMTPLFLQLGARSAQIPPAPLY
jgi:hypothetical protein